MLEIWRSTETFKLLKDFNTNLPLKIVSLLNQGNLKMQSNMKLTK